MLSELVNHLEETGNTKKKAMTRAVVFMSIGVHMSCCLPLHSSIARVAHVALLPFRIDVQEVLYCLCILFHRKQALVQVQN